MLPTHSVGECVGSALVVESILKVGADVEGGRNVGPSDSSGEGRGKILGGIIVSLSSAMVGLVLVSLASVVVGEGLLKVAVVEAPNGDAVVGAIVLEEGGPVIFPFPPRKTLVVPPDPLISSL